MLQGNNSYRLVADKDYRPGSLDSSNGPTSLEGPITLVYVAPGAAVLDFYDAKNNRSIIEIGPNNTGILLPITVMATGSNLSGEIFGFSQGGIYANR
jgi:hypothetical protein